MSLGTETYDPKGWAAKAEPRRRAMRQRRRVVKCIVMTWLVVEFARLHSGLCSLRVADG